MLKKLPSNIKKKLTKCKPDDILEFKYGKIKLYWKDAVADELLQAEGFLNIVYEDKKGDEKLIPKDIICGNVWTGKWEHILRQDKTNPKIQDKKFWDEGNSSSVTDIKIQDGVIYIGHWEGFCTILDGKTLEFIEQEFTK
jgi:hypothetical protein